MKAELFDGGEGADGMSLCPCVRCGISEAHDGRSSAGEMAEVAAVGTVR